VSGEPGSGDATTACVACGAHLRANVRFCGFCGAAQEVAAPGPGAAAQPAPGPAAARARPSGEPPPPLSPPAPGLSRAGIVPPEVWLVIAAFVVPGAWLVWSALRGLPDSLDLIGNGFGWRFGLVLTLLLVVIGMLGVGMLAIAVMLHRGDRVGRGLAYVVAGSIALGYVFADVHTHAETAAVLGALAGAALLAFAPGAQAFFTGERSRHRDIPTPIIVACTGITVYCAIAGVVALIYLVEGTLSARWLFVAAGFAVSIVLAWSRSARLMQRDILARRDISLGAIGLIILLVAFGKRDLEVIVPVALVATIAVALWIPAEARAFFGDAPLNRAPGN
jgi:hypothetical protein